MKKLLYSIVFVTTIIACSKERLQKLDPSLVQPPKEEKVKFVTPNGETDIFEILIPEVQQITINSDLDLPIIGKYGTKLFLEAISLRNENNQAVDYPIDVQFIEVLTPKDFILSNLQTVSNRRLLETAGSFYVNATKDNRRLSVSSFTLNRVISEPDFDMRLFSLETNTTLINWVTADSTNQRESIWISEGRSGSNQETPGYVIFPRSLGWWNIDKFLNSDQETTELTFSSIEPTLEQVRVYLFFYDFNSIMNITTSKTFPLPVGAKVRMLAFAKTEEDEFYAQFKDLTISKNQTVEINVTPTTEASIQQELDNLTFRSEN